MSDTHYLPIWTKMQGNRGLAVCGRFVDYASDSDQPTCEDCRRLIAVDEEQAIIQQARQKAFNNLMCYLPIRRP